MFPIASDTELAAGYEHAEEENRGKFRGYGLRNAGGVAECPE